MVLQQAALAQLMVLQQEALAQLIGLQQEALAQLIGISERAHRALLLCVPMVEWHIGQLSLLPKLVAVFCFSQTSRHTVPWRSFSANLLFYDSEATHFVSSS